MIMTGFIEEIISYSYLGAKTVSPPLRKLYKSFSGLLPSQVGDVLQVQILLLLFQHYSYFILKTTILQRPKSTQTPFIITILTQLKLFIIL
jgi:hypothetical protein